MAAGPDLVAQRLQGTPASLGARDVASERSPGRVAQFDERAAKELAARLELGA